MEASALKRAQNYVIDHAYRENPTSCKGLNHTFDFSTVRSIRLTTGHPRFKSLSHSHTHPCTTLNLKDDDEQACLWGISHITTKQTKNQMTHRCFIR